MEAIIVGGGKLWDIPKAFFTGKYIICADKGFEFCKERNLDIKYVVGDFDSIGDGSMKYLEDGDFKVLKFPEDKDKSDMEIGIDLAIEKGFKDIILVGAIGSRLDHSLNNIFQLKRYGKKDINITLYNETNTIFYTTESMEIRKEEDREYISFINIEDTKITLKGFLYDLDEKALEIGSSLQISNRIRGDFGFLQVHRGGVFVIQSRD